MFTNIIYRHDNCVLHFFFVSVIFFPKVVGKNSLPLFRAEQWRPPILNLVITETRKKNISARSGRAKQRFLLNLIQVLQTNRATQKVT